MKIINKINFFPSVCVAYTLISLSKILIEYLTWGKLGNDQGNYVSIFLISFLSTFILSQHYRLQKIPFFLLCISQYAIIIGSVIFTAWISSRFVPMHPNGYWHIFRSVTLFYMIGAIAYYLEVFHELRKANLMISQLKENGGKENEPDSKENNKRQ